LIKNTSRLTPRPFPLRAASSDASTIMLSSSKRFVSMSTPVQKCGITYRERKARGGREERERTASGDSGRSETRREDDAVLSRNKADRRTGRMKKPGRTHPEVIWSAMSGENAYAIR